MKLIISICVLILHILAFVSGSDEGNKSPVVSLEKLGKLQGIRYSSRKGREYFGFLGVPFGKIPQRFSVSCTGIKYIYDLVVHSRMKFIKTICSCQAPEPAEPWEGVKAVDQLPPTCVHFNVLLQSNLGVEDCLQLNVYTPKLQVTLNRI